MIDSLIDSQLGQSLVFANKFNLFWGVNSRYAQVFFERFLYACLTLN